VWRWLGSPLLRFSDGSSSFLCSVETDGGEESGEMDVGLARSCRPMCTSQAQCALNFIRGRPFVMWDADAIIYFTWDVNQTSKNARTTRMSARVYKIYFRFNENVN
jgi:hypothetical protein